MVEALTNRQPFGNVSNSVDDNLGQIYYEIDSTNGGFKAYRYVKFIDAITYLVTHATCFDTVNLQEVTNDFSEPLASTPYAGHVAATNATEAALIIPGTSGEYGFVQCFGHRSTILAAAGVALGDTIAIDNSAVNGQIISVVDTVSGTISAAEFNVGLLSVSVRRVGMAKTAISTSSGVGTVDAYLSGMFM